MSRPTPRNAVLVALVLLLSFGAVGMARSGPVSGADVVPAPVVEVRVSGGELTVDVRDAPLAQVLRTVGERAGVEVTLRGDLGTPVTESFTGVPLEEGIRRLALGHSVAVTYAASADAAARGIVTGVWVIGRSSIPAPSVAARSAPADLSAPLPPGRGGSSEPRPPSPQDLKADEGARDATVHVPPGDWIGGIQALAEEADRGSEAAIARLVTISASEPSAIVRRQAVAALGQLTGAEIEPALTAALADDDASVRVRAIRGLRGTDTDSARSSLTGALIGDADPQVRLAALRALASLPGPTTVQGLAKASGDPDPIVREAATRGLAWWTARLRGAP